MVLHTTNTLRLLYSCGVVLVFFNLVGNLPQLRRAPIVEVLYKQANIGFAAEAVFFLGGGKGGVSPKKRV